jgi:hypothetical protein
LTGAGSGEFLFCREQDFMGALVDSDGDSSPDVTGFGRDPTVTELDLQNQLERLRDDNSVWSAESVKQNFEGAVGVEAIVSADTHAEVEKLIFNQGPGTGIEEGLANSARVFVAANYLTGNCQRVLYGAIPLSYDIQYEQGGQVRYTLSMAYADEEPSTSTDLSVATRASDGSSVSFHGFDLQISGTSVEDLQSATLSISEIARFQRGTGPTPNRAVIAAPSASLDATALFTTPSRVDIARGNSTGGLPETVDSVTGTVTLTANDGTAVSTYDLAALKPDTYSWSEVIATEDTNDPITFHANDGVTVS